MLEEVKRLPGRRVAGVRAQAFIHEPVHAALGETRMQSSTRSSSRKPGCGWPDYERFRLSSNVGFLGYPLKGGAHRDSFIGRSPSSGKHLGFMTLDLSKFVKGRRQRFPRDLSALRMGRAMTSSFRGDTPSTSRSSKSDRGTPPAPVLITYAGLRPDAPRLSCPGKSIREGVLLRHSLAKKKGR